MTITLANTNDDYYKLDKTYNTVSTFSNASIVYPCDVLNPTFKIKGGHVNANSVTGVFGRNYWIIGQTLNDGINYISCRVDAFSSWKNNIYSTTQFVERSEKYGNPFLPDGQFPLSNKNEIDMYKGNEIVTGTNVIVLGVI